MPERLFVYGTLMTGEENAGQMEGLRCEGAARTHPGWMLYLLDGYPGAVREPAGPALEGEVWAGDEAALERLDAFEGAAEGLYRRERVPISAQSGPGTAWIYVYAGSIQGRAPIGGDWRRRS